MERLERLQATIESFLENANHALKFADGIFANCLRHEISNYSFIFEELQKAKAEIRKEGK